MDTRSTLPTRGRNTRSGPDINAALQFVNVVPNGQDESPETRAIIRSNAAYFHWRHNRPPQEKCKPRQSKTEVRRRIQNLKKGHASTPSCGSDHVTTNEISQLQSSRSHFVENVELRNYDEKCSTGPPVILSMGNTRLLGFDVDPFSSFASELPVDFVSHCVTYNAQVILPALFPDDVYASDNIKTNMLQLSVSHAPLLHMFIIGALLYSQGSLGSIPINPITLHLFRYRAEIVRQMSIILGDPVEACRDINIFVVSCLASKGPSPEIEMPSKTPKQGPLRSLQSLDSSALVDAVPIHVHGLSKLIEVKGGLEKVEMPGLAALISGSQVRIATRNLTIPSYPFVSISWPSKEFIFQHQGTGFGTDQELYRVLSMLKSYTIMIDDFCEGRKVVTASELIDHRNMSQHALLSLSPRVGISECYRLGALIYSLLVTFPLPYTTAPFKLLVEQLAVALTSWDDSDDMLIWVVTIGAIGAIGLRERKWFVEKFRKVTVTLGFRSWDEVREVLKRGLWFEATNNGDGSELWAESQTISNSNYY